MSDQQQICHVINQFIYKKFDNCIEDFVFEANSIEELGREYYQRVIQADASFLEDYVREVIKNSLPDNTPLEKDLDYYKGLCAIIGIEHLPKTVRFAVQQQYDKVFDLKRNMVFAKYDSAIEQISRDEELLAKKENGILANRTPKQFNYDIADEEKELLDLYREKDELRSKKDALVFLKDYTEESLKRFCDYQDPKKIEDAIRREALALCKYGLDSLNTVFSPYEMYLSCLEDDIDRPYALFYKIKLYSIQQKARQLYFRKAASSGEEVGLQRCKQYLNRLPKIDLLNEAKKRDSVRYLALLVELMTNYNVIGDMKDRINASVCLRNRKQVLLKAICMYECGEYAIVCALLPTQIEGIFYDLLIDATTFSRFSDLNIYPRSVLRDKIDHLLRQPDSIFVEAAEYFQNYYNNMVRNPVAHGSYYGNYDDLRIDEIMAREQMLDLGFLVYMLSRISETEKMHRFIKGYNINRALSDRDRNLCFGALFHDITGQRTHYDYDLVSKYRPLNIVYWIVNPYYEKLYESANDSSDLLALRQVFLSPDFWDYVSGMKQDVDPVIVAAEVLVTLFHYSICEETKTILQKVSAKYDEIKRKQRNELSC